MQGSRVIEEESFQQPSIEEERSQELPKEHVEFQQWAISRGVDIHDSVTPAALPGRGIGLQTTAFISKGTRILFIPEKAIFKPRKEAGPGSSKQSPHAQLALSAFKAFRNDAELQRWSATWPSERDIRESFPLFSEVQDMLPPSTQAVLKRQRVDFEADKLSVH